MSQISMTKQMTEQFSAGAGVVSLSASMTDEQILQMIKLACGWSQGKAFMVVPPSPVAGTGTGKARGRLRKKVSVGVVGALFGAILGYGTARVLSVGSGPTGLAFDVTGFCALFGAVIFSAVFVGAYSAFCDAPDKS